MSIIWSVIFGAVAFIFFQDRRTCIILSLLLFNHWVLDFIVHPPDLPLILEGSTNLGLGLWTSGPGLIISIVLELALLAAGIAIYIIWRKREKQRQGYSVIRNFFIFIISGRRRIFPIFIAIIASLTEFVHEIHPPVEKETNNHG